MSDYFILLLWAGFIPFFLSFYPKLKFYSNISSLFYSISITAFIFGAWDVFAVWRGHWSFNPSGVWKMRFINLPIEECLFFVVIPFCCIFTWEVIKYIKGLIK